MQEEIFKQTLFFLLGLHGYWPKDVSQHETYKLFLECLIKHSSIGIIFPLGTVYVVEHFEDFSTVDLFDYLTYYIETLYTVYYLIIHFKQLNSIIKLTRELGDYGEFGRPKNLDTLIINQNKNTKRVYGCTCVTILLYCAISYYEYEECELKRNHGNPKEQCKFLFYMWLPFHLMENQYVKIFVFFIQTAMLLLVLLPRLLGGSMSATLLEYITIRMNHLRCLLSDISKSLTDEENIMQIRYCLKLHIEILRLNRRINDVFSMMNGVHVILPSIIIGILISRISQNFELIHVLHLTGWLAILFNNCRKGEKLINEGEQLSTDIYSLNWYSMHPCYRPYIALFLHQSQTPIKSTAGLLYSYSYDVFMRVLNAAYSYTTIFTNFQN